MSAKILIVDDRPEMIMLLRMLIREMTPYEAVFTNNPFEAARIIKEEDIDSVITEFKMPGLDGSGLLETVEVSKFHSSIKPGRLGKYPCPDSPCKAHTVIPVEKPGADHHISA